MEAKKDKLGELLLEKGLINQDTLNKVLEIQKSTNKRLGQILLEHNFVSSQEISKALALQFNLAYVDLNQYEIQQDTLKIFPASILREHKIFPISIQGKDVVVALANPLDILILQDLKYLTDYNIKPVLSTEAEVERYLNKYLEAIESAEIVIKAGAKESDFDSGEMDLKDLKQAIEGAPVVRLVNSVINEAIEQRASDIHFEPQKNRLLLRFRIDGVLYERMNIPKNLQAPAISRVKIMSGMDIAERRKPQDGRISILRENINLDIRASTLPSSYGEKLVLRILDKETMKLSLIKLGLSEEEYELLTFLSDRPYGIILITGPTGSGKTTTLYSILNRLNDSSRNIVTVEDPIEYELEGVNQTSVNVKAGYTFATGIRHILRQDPDIIMVGEIRDMETAEIAIQAALTGHLVLSTLHTNTSSGAVARLIHMGIEPFLISSSLIGVIGQRLVRLLCPSCKKTYQPEPDLLKDISDLISQAQAEINFAQAVGCQSCHNLGYRGRAGIFEILVITPKIKELILRKATESEIEETAIKQGMYTLRQSGFLKALNQITSLEEVMRVAFLKILDVGRPT